MSPLADAVAKRSKRTAPSPAGFDSLLVQAVEAIRCPAVLLDCNGTIVHINQGFQRGARERGLGVSPRAVGLSFRALYRPPRFLPEIADGIQHVVDGVESTFHSHIMCSGPGVEHLCLVDAARLQAEGGPPYVLISHSDAGAEARLREAESRFREIADIAPVMIWMTAPDGHCIYVNHRWTHFSGRSLEEELGEGWLELIHPRERDPFHNALKHLIEERQPLNFELRLRRFDGQYHWMMATGTPRFTSTGVFVGYIGSCFDIDTSRQAEEGFRSTTQMLRLALEAAGSAAWQWNVGTGEHLWLGGRSDLASIRGTADPEMSAEAGITVHPEDRERVLAAIRAARDQNQPVREEFRIVGQDGLVRWQALRGQFFHEDEFQPTRMLGVATDISERREVEENLHEVSARLIDAQEKECSRMARELHDDVNQRLAVLAIELQRLEERQDNAILRRSLRNAWESATAISDEIQRISHHLHSSTLCLLGLPTALRGLCSEIAEQTGIGVDFTADPLPAKLGHDLSLCFFRVAQEALKNAVTHGHAKRAQLELTRAKGELRLRVIDDGRGFDIGDAKRKGGLGIVSMRERLRIVGGTLRIHRGPHGGTEVVAAAPLGKRIRQPRSGEKQ